MILLWRKRFLLHAWWHAHYSYREINNKHHWGMKWIKCWELYGVPCIYIKHVERLERIWFGILSTEKLLVYRSRWYHYENDAFDEELYMDFFMRLRARVRLSWSSVYLTNDPWPSLHPLALQICFDSSPNEQLEQIIWHRSITKLKSEQMKSSYARALRLRPTPHFNNNWPSFFFSNAQENCASLY